MKLNLVLHPSQYRPGYTNVGPTGWSHPAAEVTSGCLTDLDTVVADAEATEILAWDVLDFLPPSVVDDAVVHWVKKLRQGGTLTLSGLELPEVARAIAAGRLAVADSNVLLYGVQDAAWRSRKSALSLAALERSLTARGLVAQSKSISGYFFRLTVKRP